ncbi:MAG: hypothetical protein FWB86_06795 [Treponema sp.]|nr:hypothetical protein [Treponema sp.]MCL2250869.1 hypothetical protein [Treponema sp.]
MYKLIKISIIVFLIITLLTALLTLAGIFYLWFIKGESNLLFIGSFVALITEIAGVIILFVKKGLRYFPEVKEQKTMEETKEFLEKFITLGTSATIVGNRLSWLINNESMIKILNEKIKEGLKIEIITPQPIKKEIINKLPGVDFIVSNDTNPAEARFILINGNRRGSERLAIPNDVHPDFKTTIFDNISCPQIIAMAREIINKSKRRLLEVKK